VCLALKSIKACIMTNKTTYHLSIGEADKQRMSELNRLYNPPTKEMLVSAGLHKGAKVLDIACGTGIITKWLSEQVGPEGQVHAIDQSEEQLEIAKHNTAELDNITYENKSVFDLSHLQESFDFVYCRFLLVHLDNPVEALKAMISTLKTGGKLIIVSATHEHQYSYPENASYNKFFKMACEIMGQGGRDFYFGKRLIPVLKSLGMQIKGSQFYMPILESKHDKQFIELSLSTVYDLCLNNGVTEDEYNELREGLIEFSEDENSYGTFADCMIVAGEKL
jgi:ubiquinone/menaquinone biosynthesis C-methylase UbiE